MRNSLSIIAWVSSAFVLSGCVPTDEGEVLDAPDSVVVGFGIVEGTRAPFEVSFENISSEVLTINRIDASCGCITLGDVDFPIELESGSIHTSMFAYDTNRRLGDSVTFVYAHCKQRREFTKVVKVRANVQAAIMVSPMSALLATGSADSQRRNDEVIKISLHPSLLSVEPSIISVPDYLEGELTKVGEAVWELKIAIRQSGTDTLPVGYSTEVVIVDFGEKQAEIQTIVERHGFTVIPNRISLTQKGDTKIKRPITIVSSSQIVNYEVDSCSFASVLEGRSFDQRIELDIEIDISKARSGEMKIDLNGTESVVLTIDVLPQ